MAIIRPRLGHDLARVQFFGHVLVVIRLSLGHVSIRSALYSVVTRPIVSSPIVLGHISWPSLSRLATVHRLALVRLGLGGFSAMSLGHVSVVLQPSLG